MAKESAITKKHMALGGGGLSAGGLLLFLLNSYYPQNAALAEHKSIRSEATLRDAVISTRVDALDEKMKIIKQMKDDTRTIKTLVLKLVESKK